MSLRRSLIFFLLILATAVSACQSTTTPVVNPAATQCPGGTAEIGVGDGFFEFLCGCTGGPAGGTFVPTPGNLTCHVPSGTVVMFEYIAIQTEHQIVSSGGLPFASAPPVLPGGVTASAAQFQTVGTYNFQDAYNTALTGAIIVP